MNERLSDFESEKTIAECAAQRARLPHGSTSMAHFSRFRNESEKDRRTLSHVGSLSIFDNRFSVCDPVSLLATIHVSALSHRCARQCCAACRCIATAVACCHEPQRRFCSAVYSFCFLSFSRRHYTAAAAITYARLYDAERFVFVAMRVVLFAVLSFASSFSFFFVCCLQWFVDCCPQ